MSLTLDSSRSPRCPTCGAEVPADASDCPRCVTRAGVTDSIAARLIAARPPGPVRRAAEWVRRRPVHAALAATLVVAIPAAAYCGQRTMRERIEARGAPLAPR